MEETSGDLIVVQRDAEQQPEIIDPPAAAASSTKKRSAAENHKAPAPKRPAGKKPCSICKPYVPKPRWHDEETCWFRSRKAEDTKNFRQASAQRQSFAYAQFHGYANPSSTSSGSMPLPSYSQAATYPSPVQQWPMPTAATPPPSAGVATVMAVLQAAAMVGARPPTINITTLQW